MKILYDWLKEYCGETIPSVAELETVLTFHAFEIDGVEKVGKDTVLDVKILPDRSSDCLSHRGIAREIATLTNTPLVNDPFRTTPSLSLQTEKIRITVADAGTCDRFALAVMTGIIVKESPQWLKERLEALGQRSINNVVDATNYVMLALGQPLHAYDADRFPHDESGWHFVVRMAEGGEVITTLSGDTYTLTPQIQLIADGLTGKPAGIAGIKGGKLAEIDQSTTRIILEAGHFHSQVTRKGAQALRLQTEASKRFENNPSPELIPYALNEVVLMISKIAGGVCEGYVDTYLAQTKSVSVTLMLSRVNELLGLSLDEGIVESILGRLGFHTVSIQGGFEVTAPWERTDIVIPEDIIAEIGRVYGYEYITSVLPKQIPLTEFNTRFFYSEMIREYLVGKGYSEIITSSFRKKDTVLLHNALASDKQYLRSMLRENVREALEKNIPYVDLLGISRVMLFEIGTVFEKTQDDVIEHLALAIGIRSKQRGYTPEDDEALTECVSFLEREIGMPLYGTIHAGVYECNLTTVFSELPAIHAYGKQSFPEDVIYVPFSNYPFVSRDVALWVPVSLSAEEIEKLIRAHAGELLSRITLFDTFEKGNRVSYAFRLIFQSATRTLTDEEVGGYMTALTQALIERGFETR